MRCIISQVKILLFGHTGMLGKEFLKVTSDYELYAMSSSSIDFTNPAKIRAVLSKYTDVNWIVNCAGYTNVDKAEEEPERAKSINYEAVCQIGLFTKKHGINFMHVSSDYVFDGTKNEPYTEDDKPNPLNVYGNSKLMGETFASHVIRSSWLFGNGKCFPKTLIDLAKTLKNIVVTDTQIGTPTSSIELAWAMQEIIRQNVVPGIYHYSGAEVISWYEFAKIIKDTFGLDIEIEKGQYETVAVRPSFSALSSKKLRDLGIGPHWDLKNTLEYYMKDWTEEGVLIK